MRKPAWLAEVAVQSVMIVLSILLALWVDQWKQQRSERDLVIASLSNFLKEAQQNQARLDDILPYHKGLRSMLGGLEKSPSSIKTAGDFQSAIGVDGLRPPFLVATAWQTAVATGALTKIDYATVSALSLTYTLQDRFREESRSGIQNVLQASNFAFGHADGAIHVADMYLQEVILNEEELRATYAQVTAVLHSKLAGMAKVAPQTLTDSAASRPRQTP